MSELPRATGFQGAAEIAGSDAARPARTEDRRYIDEVLVRDNERMAAGQVLARIDDRDFRAALAQAQAGIDAAEAAIAQGSAKGAIDNDRPC